MEIKVFVLLAECLLLGLVRGATIAPLEEYREQDTISPMPVDSSELAEINEADVPDVWEYLRHYEYMTDDEEKTTNGASSYRDMSEPIKRFQREAGLPETGEMNEETIKTMRLPRCGMTEKTFRDQRRMRKKRFTVAGRRWSSPALTYRLSRSSTTNSVLPQPAIENIMRKAFKVWSDVTPLTFTKRGPTETVDIDIRFAQRSHGDGSPFDGRGRTLAHAFFPGGGGSLSGDAHFDDDESFSDKSFSGVNLFQVAAHEFGHSLGLGHSTDQNALMAPFYRGYQPNFRLHQDDINGIQSLYGGEVVTPRPNPPTDRPNPPTDRPRPTYTPRPDPTPDPVPTPTPVPESCNPQFDAMASARALNRRALTYGFSGTQYYDLSRGLAPRPQNIRQRFTYMDTVDAAFASPLKDQRTPSTVNLYLFANQRVYYYRMDVDKVPHTLRFITSQPLTQTIPGLPPTIDAIFQWSRNGKLYVFSGRQYYRLSQNRVEPGYPRDIRVWNMPAAIQKVDSVVTYTNGRSYFFAENKYYAFDDARIRFSNGFPIGQVWIRCQASNNIEESTLPSTGGIERIRTVLEEEAEKTSGAPVTIKSSLIVVMVSACMALLQKHV